MLAVHLRCRTMAAPTRFLLCLGFLSALLTVAFGNPITIDAAAIDTVTNETVSVNMNRLFDLMLPDIQNFILRRGLDPMQLGDISKNLNGVIHSRFFNLTNGWLQGMSNVKRNQDVILSYKNKVLSLDATLAIKLVSASYDYLFKGALITRRGYATGNANNLNLRVVMAVDMKYYKIVLSKLQIHIDKVELRLQGNALDPVLNAAVKSVTHLFRRKVVETVEKEVTRVVQNFLNNINRKIPQPDILKGNDIFNYLPASYDFPAVVEVN